jgi:hypothetical protein
MRDGRAGCVRHDGQMTADEGQEGKVAKICRRMTINEGRRGCVRDERQMSQE